MALKWEYGKRIVGVWHEEKDGDLNTKVWVRPDSEDEDPSRFFQIRGQNREDQAATTAILMHAMHKDLPCGVGYLIFLGYKLDIRGAIVFDT
jgi:hypothetical protein